MITIKPIPDMICILIPNYGENGLEKCHDKARQMSGTAATRTRALAVRSPQPTYTCKRDEIPRGKGA